MFITFYKKYIAEKTEKMAF